MKQEEKEETKDNSKKKLTVCTSLCIFCMLMEEEGVDLQKRSWGPRVEDSEVVVEFATKLYLFNFYFSCMA